MMAEEFMTGSCRRCFGNVPLRHWIRTCGRLVYIGREYVAVTQRSRLSFWPRSARHLPPAAAFGSTDELRASLETEDRSEPSTHQLVFAESQACLPNLNVQSGN